MQVDSREYTFRVVNMITRQLICLYPWFEFVSEHSLQFLMFQNNVLNLNILQNLYIRFWLGRVCSITIFSLCFVFILFFGLCKYPFGSPIILLKSCFMLYWKSINMAWVLHTLFSWFMVNFTSFLLSPSLSHIMKELCLLM